MRRFIPVLFLALAMLCACGEVPAEDASPQHLAELREEYPYINSSLGSYSLNSVPDGAWAKAAQILFVAEIVDDHTYTSEYAYPGTAEDPGPLMTIGTYFIPIKITRVIGVNQDYKLKDEEAYASIARGAFSPGDNFKVGTKLVVFGFDWDEYKGKTEFSLAEFATFYLTDDGYVLSITDYPMIDAYSGRSLENFISDMDYVMEKSGW